MISSSRAVIFANGELRDLGAVHRVLQPGDFLVAADGGLRHLRSLGLLPNLLIGDLDSVSEEDADLLRSSGVEVRRYPVEKNETDLELALEAVSQAGYSSIRVVAALGGRLDQTLANLFLLRLPGLEHLDLRLDDGLEEVVLIRHRLTLVGGPGDVVSLLPLDGPAGGIQTDGLYYQLKHETLFPEHTRGISNVMLGSEASISLERGQLLCVHSRSKNEEIL